MTRRFGDKKIKRINVKMIRVKIIKNGDRITGCAGLTGFMKWLNA
jgi:hypothetical protein